MMPPSVADMRYMPSKNICWVKIGKYEICGKRTKGDDYRCPAHRREWEKKK